MIERRHEGQAALGRTCSRWSNTSPTSRTVQDHLGAVVAAGVHLGPHGRRRHHDRRHGRPAGAGPRVGLRRIARRHRDHPARRAPRAESDASTDSAPRGLNEPVFWRCSALRWTRSPADGDTGHVADQPGCGRGGQHRRPVEPLRHEEPGRLDGLEGNDTVGHGGSMAGRAQGTATPNAAGRRGHAPNVGTEPRPMESQRSTAHQAAAQATGDVPMRRLLAATAAALFTLLAAAGPILACGGLIGPNGAVNLLRTTTFAGYHDGMEHYVTAFQFAGGGGKFGSIVAPARHPGDRGAGRRLDPAATGEGDGRPSGGMLSRRLPALPRMRPAPRSSWKRRSTRWTSRS